MRFALNLYPGPRTNSQVSLSGCRRRVRFKGPSPSRWAGRSREAPAARPLRPILASLLPPPDPRPSVGPPPPVLGARIPGPPHHLSALGARTRGPRRLSPRPSALGASPPHSPAPLCASALGSTHTPSRTLLPTALGPRALPSSAGAGTQPRSRAGPGARGDPAAAGSVSARRPPRAGRVPALGLTSRLAWALRFSQRVQF